MGWVEPAIVSYKLAVFNSTSKASQFCPLCTKAYRSALHAIDVI